MSGERRFVSRAGEKLDAALEAFAERLFSIEGIVAADLGANVGGFTDCLLKWGAARVYAVETGYGVLDWGLRQDERVVAMERTNALHVELPEAVDMATIDVAWTRQRMILPAAARMLKPGGCIVSLVKPQYEADRKSLRRGVLPESDLPDVLDQVRRDVATAGLAIAGEIDSPIQGAKGNTEYVWLIGAA